RGERKTGYAWPRASTLGVFPERQDMAAGCARQLQPAHGVRLLTHAPRGAARNKSSAADRAGARSGVRYFHGALGNQSPGESISDIRVSAAAKPCACAAACRNCPWTTRSRSADPPLL